MGPVRRPSSTCLIIHFLFVCFIIFVALFFFWTLAECSHILEGDTGVDFNSLPLPLPQKKSHPVPVPVKTTPTPIKLPFWRSATLKTNKQLKLHLLIY